MPKTLHDFVSEALESVVEVQPEDVDRMSAQGWQIVDVRGPDEFAEGHLPNAVSFPRGFLEVRADLEHYKRDDRLADRSQKLICYCGGGHRSALACRTLQEMGFENVRSLAEGWTGWTERGLPVEGQNGS
jgi:rhodanese-related sulfurtransferase